MPSLARQHMMRHQAQQQAVAIAEYGGQRETSIQELQSFQLAQHRARLKQIQSTPAKRDFKIMILPEYAPYIEGILAADQGGQDDVVTTIMLWRIDAGDYAGALEIGAYAIRHDLKMPDRFERQTPNIIAEEIANAALTSLKTGRDFDLDILLQTYALVKDIDMHDQIVSKLHLAIGKLALELTLRFDMGPRIQELSLLAVQHLKIAVELDPACGGKTALGQATKLVEKHTLLDKPPEDANLQKAADQVASTADKLNQALGGKPPEA